MVVPCSQPNLIEHLAYESQKQRDQIARLKKQNSKLKTKIVEKDKTISKQKNVYTEMRTIRDKFRVSEKEGIEQEKVIRELK